MWLQGETQERLRKTKFIISTGPRDARGARHAGPQGQHQGWSGSRRSRIQRVGWGVDLCQGLHWGFVEGEAGQEKQVRTGWLECFSRLPVRGVSPTCLFPDSRIIKAEEYCPRWLQIAYFACQGHALCWALCCV